MLDKFRARTLHFCQCLPTPQSSLPLRSQRFTELRKKPNDRARHASGFDGETRFFAVVVQPPSAVLCCFLVVSSTIRTKKQQGHSKEQPRAAVPQRQRARVDPMISRALVISSLLRSTLYAPRSTAYACVGAAWAGPLPRPPRRWRRRFLPPSPVWAACGCPCACCPWLCPRADAPWGLPWPRPSP